jgi:SlyX protein
MQDDALERIELKIAFLENANNELSDVIYRQQREIDELKLEVKSLTSQVEAFKESPQRSAADEKPPHY